jgi:hypothetical protein
VHAKALSAYIALNVALCFPEICDPSAGRTDRTDYRHTGFYQYMLRQCTMSATSKATPYPHQRFFGIPDTHFDEFNTIDEEHWLCRTSIYDSAGFLYEDHYGLLSFDEFVNLESSLADEYQPMKPDVIFVQQLLFSKGLPAELMLEIMDLADYKEKRVLKVPHDPLHPANRAELNEYLDQCWQTIISCDILSDTLDMKAIDWQDRVHRGVKWLFHNPETLGYTLGTKCTVK